MRQKGTNFSKSPVFKGDDLLNIFYTLIYFQKDKSVIE
jgi:hypothetical protein